ncbi:phosphate ABC transporter substrate-binding protein, PhoT family (TC 3.A.1.7.1) [Desulfacinum hydrothermale DSM 13146]|uniref:Phosphate ABC transporter substrate-binding protein, PhoT family (TC 3.A.1.7.1) n=1 Tax=Desulfacinum hydrothermale DSM 13146 TaxID=1121390 RepID=A0A1W1XST8_9BACT|nr:PstS family phosphate ABC transporter substrate-binding protein [Desulfacinum hydrothermale]SMC26598.1 phosphate ABC transporter substrate-binding protein, PhoT family (TC 3.A.1.7.1) [Desulfacinum hydrothermale DSM 13146]
MKKIICVLGMAVVLGLSQAPAATARDYISIVGSSTVYPFSTTVAEHFGKTTPFKTPKVESTGSGGGFKLFCAGVGVQHPDITNASRAIKPSEKQTCAQNGVREIVQVKIGYDGIVLAQSKKVPAMHLSRRDIFLALAKEVPDPSGAEKTVPNPYKTWKDVNPQLPDVKIEVLGPPPTSGTRDAFLELAMQGGAKSFKWLKELKKKDKKLFKKIAHTLREDGAYIDAGENDNLIVQKLEANPNALGIFGFSYLDQNADKIQGAFVDGVEPTFENISAQKYPLSRPLFFYVKKAHVGTIPGIQEYIAEFTSEKAWGPEGYLADKGLIPLPDEERSKMREVARKLEVMPME